MLENNLGGSRSPSFPPPPAAFWACFGFLLFLEAILCSCCEAVGNLSCVKWTRTRKILTCHFQTFKCVARLQLLVCSMLFCGYCQMKLPQLICFGTAKTFPIGWFCIPCFWQYFINETYAKSVNVVTCFYFAAKGWHGCYFRILRCIWKSSIFLLHCVSVCMCWGSHVEVRRRR